MSNRYEGHGGAETQFEPGSNDEVLRNLVGIKSKREMDQAEYESLSRTQFHYAKNVLTVETPITVSLICQMHFDWLGGLYDWAGKYRTVNVSKGNFKWPPYGYIDANMMEFESGLLSRHTPCRASQIPDLARTMAEIHAEFLIIHPFRDGNGRVARWIADIMAMQAGLLAPEYEFSGPDAEMKKANYIRYVRQGYDCDFEPLSAFFSGGTGKTFG